MYTRTVETRTLRVNHVYRNREGGFLLYFKLYMELWSQLGVIKNSIPFWQLLWFVVIMIIKTPWWLIIKPLGCVFSTVTRFNGEFTIENGKIWFENSTVKKTKIWKIVGIPFFIFIGKPNENEYQKLAGN